MLFLISGIRKLLRTKLFKKTISISIGWRKLREIRNCNIQKKNSEHLIDSKISRVEKSTTTTCDFSQERLEIAKRVKRYT